MFAHCLAFRAGIPARMDTRHKEGPVKLREDSHKRELEVYKRIMAGSKGGVGGAPAAPLPETLTPFLPGQ